MVFRKNIWLIVIRLGERTRKVEKKIDKIRPKQRKAEISLYPALKCHTRSDATNTCCFLPFRKVEGVYRKTFPANPLSMANKDGDL